MPRSWMTSWATQFTTGPDGDLYQLPDQQFANLYWFRKDWFDRRGPAGSSSRRNTVTISVFRSTGRPMRTLPSFFSEDVKEIDGVQHLWPHGLRQARTGPWMAHDRCLAVHGRCRLQGPEPNGIPIDEWGIRMEEGTCNPAGASASAAVARQTALLPSTRSANGTNGCANTRLREPLRTSTSTSRCRRSAQGNVAQQIFWYTAFTASTWWRPEIRWQQHGRRRRQPTLADGALAAWSRTGKMVRKLGYQDAGSWTLFESTPVDRRKAAWLYAQFVVSKTVDVKKSHVGLTFIRDSSVNHESVL